jgi:hypothetical protein
MQYTVNKMQLCGHRAARTQENDIVNENAAIQFVAVLLFMGK